MIACAMLTAQFSPDKLKKSEMTKLEPPTKNAHALPQQSLLLELLNMSGEIAVMGAKGDSLLWNTVHECHRHHWITLHILSDTATTIRLANSGRDLLKS